MEEQPQERCLFPYFVNDDNNKAYIFSALDTGCTALDFADALESKVIVKKYYDALVENTYGGIVPIKADYWLEL